MLETVAIDAPMRVGLFSYGSGCCSEFYSGVVTPASGERLRAMRIPQALDRRHRLTIEEYETLLRGESVVRFGTKDAELNHQIVPDAWPVDAAGDRLVLDAVVGYHRKYIWI